MSTIDTNKTVLIMAGGTGGHVFPALSIAEYLIEKGVKVEWLGTVSGLEAKVIGESDIPIHYISVSGLRGKSMWKKIMAPFVIFLALLQSMKELIKIKPECVLGMGGFVTGPGGVAAWLLRKRLCIHEQNAIAGISNQLLSPLAYKVMEAFPGAFERKKEMASNKFLRLWTKTDGIILVGNPVRNKILNCEGSQKAVDEEPGNLKILIVGGSLGAVAINKIIPELLMRYSEESRPQVIHQCGKRNLTETQAMYKECGINENNTTTVCAFIDDMAEAYQWADIVICRSGALTVSEIANIGLPSILIPYPTAVDDHQSENAKILERVGAAEILEQKQMSAEKLAQMVNKYIENPELIIKASQAARAVARPDATRIAAETCLEACNV